MQRGTTRVGLDGIDVTDRIFAINGPARLDVVLASGAGQVLGTVTDHLDIAVPFIRVVLIPQSNRDHAGLYRVGITDQDGRFSIQGVVPGSYMAIAWEGSDPLAFYDQSFLEIYREKAQSLLIAEGSIQQLRLRATHGE